MKKSIITLAGVFTILFLGTGVSYAQMGMMGGSWGHNNTATQVTENQEMKDVLLSIYTSQNITTAGEVDCSQITDGQFDELGDAYMGTMLPNKQQHETMDTMMGGEGSASLGQAHINMGRSYLGCWSDYNGGPVYMPMMVGIGTMETGGYGHDEGISRFNHNSMMDYGFAGMGGFGGGLFMILFWVLVIAGTFALIKYFTNSNQGTPSTKSALDILKERYARGEIDKEEYETKKKDM